VLGVHYQNACLTNCRHPQCAFRLLKVAFCPDLSARKVHLEGPLVDISCAWLSVCLGKFQHVLPQFADWHSMAAAVSKHFLAALQLNSIELLAEQLMQRVAHCGARLSLPTELLAVLACIMPLSLCTLYPFASPTWLVLHLGQAFAQVFPVMPRPLPTSVSRLEL